MFAKLMVCGVLVAACTGRAAGTELLATASTEYHHADVLIQNLTFDPRAVFALATVPGDEYVLSSSAFMHWQLSTQIFDATTPSCSGLADWVTNDTDDLLALDIKYSYFSYLGYYNGTYGKIRRETSWFGGASLAGMEVELIRLKVLQLAFWQNPDTSLMGVDAIVRWEFWGTVPEPTAAVCLLAYVLCLRPR